MAFIKDLMDSSNRKTEAHIFLTVVVVLAFVALSAVVVVKSGVFDASAFGQGVGMIFAGGGLGAAGQGLQRKLDGTGENDNG